MINWAQNISISFRIRCDSLSFVDARLRVKLALKTFGKIQRQIKKLVLCSELRNTAFSSAYMKFKAEHLINITASFNHRLNYVFHLVSHSLI